MTDIDDIPEDNLSDDTYDLDELPFDEEEDGEGGSSGEGGGGGKAPRRYRVIVEPFLDFADDPSLSPEENAERKLRLLAISPMSILVPGASSFASENDLSRKIFMVDVGQANGEACGSDMADPDFVGKRDALQRQRRTFFGIPHPSLVLSGGSALVSAMVGAFAGFAAAVSGQAKLKTEKGAKKADSRSRRVKLLDFSLGKELTFGAKESDPYKSEPSVRDLEHASAFGEILDHMTVKTVTETVEVSRTALEFDTLSSFFNFLSEVAKGPVAKVSLKGVGGKGGAQQAEGPATPWNEFSPLK